MTPEEMVRALVYRRHEVQALSEAVGTDLNAALSANLRLDHPSVAWLREVRANLDTAVGALAQAIIHAQEPAATARRIAAEREQQP